MYNRGTNNKIEIDTMSNGYLVSITRPQKEPTMTDTFGQIMPLIERMQNKITGDDWKNQVEEQMNEALKREQPKPFEQFVCKTWKEVINLINAHQI